MLQIISISHEITHFNINKIKFFPHVRQRNMNAFKDHKYEVLKKKKKRKTRKFK